MSEIKIQEALKKIKNSIPWKKIFIYGEETYLIEQLLKKISQIKDTEKYYLDENLPSVYQFSGTSLFGNSPLPVFLNAQSLPSLLKKKKEKEKFLKFLSSLEEFVIVAPEPLDYKQLKNETFQSVIDLSEVVIKAQEYTEDRIVALLEKKFKAAQKNLDKKLLKLIVEIVGTNLYDLKQETDKLLNYPGELTEETIKKLLYSSGKVNVFELIVPLIKKDKKGYLKQLNQALSQGIEPLLILGLLQSQVRNLIALKVGEKTKLPLNALKTFKILSSQTNLKELFGLLKLLHEKEFEIKSGKTPQDLALKELIFYN